MLSPSLSAPQRHTMLRQMLTIRAAEDQVQTLFVENVISGTTHLANGQEAVAVALAAHVQAARGDTVTCTYRGHSHALALGMGLQPFFAELMGKAAGCSKGKGGSMHLTDLSIGLIGTFAVVGAGLPITLGAALTAQVKHSAAVHFTLFGDGAVNIGAWHESLNLAAVWRLPVILICENNLYGEYTPYALTSPVPNVADRAAAYGIPARIVDGQDAEALHAVLLEAVQHAQSGAGPTLVEAKTYRYRGHSRTDPAAYRPPGELEQWLQRDPIHILADRMIADGQLTPAAFDTLSHDIDSQVEAAVQWALQQPYPDTSTLYEDIWA
ncbi:MAG: pyruvate dehydrogenase (acetyl-transferring) E1 component subunit alpha [Anaerolineae bacterium]|nr:pyruvate dehydrogenase (acetyl-transferring) E1 component subunit alpha [Anaerolineae bacterium]